ncbi:hypothetical protein PoB_004923700 [Plakobranchus ocellatus]|uniref:Uncharacterized protein n=1 Tax=Plakobranchus ocellatus TaxID=259542 RepID=A0AAV4BTJ9_9GAST|nr:hypothetical protein PoB_004923700 [Plakobranchus ocellatus]
MSLEIRHHQQTARWWPMACEPALEAARTFGSSPDEDIECEIIYSRIRTRYAQGDGQGWAGADENSLASLRIRTTYSWHVSRNSFAEIKAARIEKTTQAVRKRQEEELFSMIPKQDDLRLSGPPSDLGTSGGTPAPKQKSPCITSGGLTIHCAINAAS